MKAFIVCLLRDAEDDDAYLCALQAAGFRPFAVPVLRFVFVNQLPLGERMRLPDSYSGLILTSPRAAEALAAVPFDAEKWRYKPVFVVGPKTAHAVRNFGLLPTGEEAGSAVALADLITRQSFGRPLLFLCGNRRHEALPERIAENRIPIEELCIYETHLVMPDLTGYPPPDWLVFFSPSGVEAAQQATGVLWRDVQKAAIGPATAAALESAGWPPAAIAAAPTPEALVDALCRAVLHRGPRGTAA